MTVPAAQTRRSLRLGSGLLALAIVAIVIAVAFPALRRLRDVVAVVRTKPMLPYPVPVDGVRPRMLADTWGAPRSGNRRHRGIDIFAACGTPVVSATDGVVFTVGTNMLGGQIVRILGPGGHWHYYAHLSRYGDVREGQRVAAGAILGYVGDTGNAKGTPCHLHYGVYTWSNVAQNPYLLLSDSSSRPAGGRTDR